MLNGEGEKLVLKAELIPPPIRGENGGSDEGKLCGEKQKELEGVVLWDSFRIHSTLIGPVMGETNSVGEGAAIGEAGGKDEDRSTGEPVVIGEARGREAAVRGEGRVMGEPREVFSGMGEGREGREATVIGEGRDIGEPRPRDKAEERGIGEEAAKSTGPLDGRDGKGEGEGEAEADGGGGSGELEEEELPTLLALMYSME